MKLCLFCNSYKLQSRYDGGMAIKHDVPFMMSPSTAAVTGCREVADFLCDKAAKLRDSIKIRPVFVSKGKRKAIPLQAWRGREGPRRLRLPDFKTRGT